LLRRVYLDTQTGGKILEQLEMQQHAGDVPSVDPSPLAITDARIVDYTIAAAELVDLVGNCSWPSDGGEVPGDNSASAGCRREGVATSTLVSPVNTTSWPWSIRSRAAMRPRPSDDPVMKIRATLVSPKRFVARIRLVAI
jgi:hypothetical protein